MPLHPSLVHLPLGLAVLMPLLAAGFGWAVWTGRVRLRAWLTIVALQAMLLTSGLVALQTGRVEEERVENVVSEAAIHTHEEAAELFLWAVGLTAVVSALAMAMPKVTISRGLIAASTIMMAACLGLAIRVGHAGGQLVYAGNAGSAYIGTSTATPAPGGAAGPDSSRAGDDEDDRKSGGK